MGSEAASPAFTAPDPASRAPDVITFGEAMALFIATRSGPLARADTFIRRTAGAETNVAIGLARLGLRVAWCSRLGADSLGRFLLEAMRGEGIDCSHVMTDASHDTGLMFKGVVDDGSDPPVEYHRRGSAASRMTADDLDVAWLRSTRHLHVSGIFPALSPGTCELTRQAMACVRQAGGTITFDPNLRPALWSDETAMREVINELAAVADTVLPGLDEGAVLTGTRDPATIARFYRERGARRVIIKLGAQGAFVDDEQAGRASVEASPVERIVDTVGAGDGFAVGVISALLEGRTAIEAARRGAWIGARAVQVRGDTEGLPTRAELDAWTSTRRP